MRLVPVFLAALLWAGAAATPAHAQSPSRGSSGYYGPYSDELKPFVEAMLAKRVAVKITPRRIRSWDHRKLGLPSTGAPAGSTMSVAGRRAR